MISFNEALTRIFESVGKLTAQTISVDESLGFVTVEDIISPINLPPFDNSAMDGYAMKVGKLTSWQVDKLGVSQIIKAGDAPHPLEAGTCAKIMTGAPVPEDADTVIPIEDVEIKDDKVIVLNKPVTGQHIRRIGEDIKMGELVLRAGTHLSHRHIALLSALGITTIKASKKPKVIIIATGSELIEPGNALSSGKIYDSNCPALKSTLREIGIIADSKLIKDDEDFIASCLKEALINYDIILTVGGVSVGDYDYVKAALKKLGVEEIFHKVAIKPGKPFYFGIFSPHPDPLPRGERENCFIFGLPGNPVSALITFAQFVKPAILKLQGAKKFENERFIAVADTAIKCSKDKVDFLKGIYFMRGDKMYVRSAGNQGSAMLRSLAEANCTIIAPEDKGSIIAGETVEVELW
jgi:molybdopterin molybdotransferase